MRAARRARTRPTQAGPQERVRLGGWLAIPEPLVVEVAGRAGYDWVGLDLQHGAWDLGTAFRGIQLLDLLGVPILVRVSEEDLPLIPLWESQNEIEFNGHHVGNIPTVQNPYGAPAVYIQPDIGWISARLLPLNK